MKITVCTPTYNRGYLLDKLYNSLKIQKFKDFEWLIVNDGSTDNTEEIVNKYINENKININYINKKNGGKHTALNIGIDNARGELFWIVDSDDFIVENALETIWSWWQQIDNKKEFAGVSGLRGHNNKSVIGSYTDDEYLDADYLEYRYKYKIKGDKAEVYRTDILRMNKFPEFKGEKYVTEATVWNRIANQGYKIRWYNKIIYICEYLQGGLTNTSDANIIKSWNGTTLYYKEIINNNKIPIKEKILYAIRSYLHYCHEKNIGLRGILNITLNPFYILIGAFIILSKRIKRLVINYR